MSLMETFRRAFSRTAAGAVASGAARREEDNRIVSRTPQRMRTGYVWNEKLITARPCMFKDLSVKGARIEVLGEPIKPALLADGVKLYFDTEKHEIQCSVAWSKGRVLGLKFLGRAGQPSRKYG